MRYLLACLLLTGCTDAADVPTTVAHVHLAATCGTTDCSANTDVLYNDCGPAGSTAITPTTRSVEVLTSYDAKDIAGYVQLQYSIDQPPPGAAMPEYQDYVLRDSETSDVYSAYDYELLYRITPTGEIMDIDTAKLVAGSGNELHFAYAANGISATEDHVIDAAMPVRVETDDPGIMDACCSVGRSQDGALVFVAVFASLRRRRRRRGQRLSPI
jgi:hypothetical protein